MLTVYSKANCTNCDKAKGLLKLRGVQFEEVRIDLDTEKRDWLVEQGHRTVPQIYKNGELFVEGGFQGLETKLATLADNASDI
jgi:glutaredoxin 3